MRKLSQKTGLIIALLLGLLAIVLAGVMLNGMRSDNRNPLTDVLEAGDSAMAAVGRSYESLTSFVRADENLSRELLNLAHESQECADTKLTYVKRTAPKSDPIITMAQNYGYLLNSSHIMTEGVDNLLTINDDLEETLYYYRQGAYENASEKASVCLQTLNPLVDQFKAYNQSIEGINYRFVASSHTSRMKQAVDEYRSATKIYLDYISLLKSIAEGADYLKAMGNLNDLFDQLQQALANNDYQAAQRIMDEISQQLQQLNNQSYQQAASTASEIDPKLFEGSVYNTALDVQNLLKDLKDIGELEKYLQSTGEYVKALEDLNQGNIEGAQEAIRKGLELLGPGQTSSDIYLQRLLAGLRNAYNTLDLRIRGWPDIG
jgi:hypothetical protein